MKTRGICIFLAALLTLGMLSGAWAETVSYPVRVEGAIFGGNAGESISTQLEFDVRWLTEGDNTQYNGELASFAALVSADAYFRTKDVERGTQNRVLLDGADAAEYDWTALLKAVGFSDAQYIESYKAKEYAGDSNDSATLALGYLCADELYDVYAIVLRGCFSAQEWLSVFDPGAAGEDYVSYTGAHPEWTEARHYKGLDVAANRAMEFIDEFIAAHDDPNRENRILITGHSRGGLLAEMIGAAFERAGVKSFTYAFNTMPVTTDPEAENLRTIFNICDENDFYGDVFPFAEETFYRYGRMVSADIAGSDEIRAEIAKLRGGDDFVSLNAEALAEYRSLFGQRFADRASLYTPETCIEVFDTKEDAQARLEELRAWIGAEAGLGLETFCAADLLENADGTASVTLNYCGAALLWGYSKILAYGDAAYGVFLSIFRGDEPACRIADFLAENAAEISGGHLLCATYALAKLAESN